MIMAPKIRTSAAKTSKSKRNGASGKANGKANGRGARAQAGNTDKLVGAGVFATDALSARHRKVIDTKLSTADVKALIKAKKLLSPRGGSPWPAGGASARP
jgi:hypothetical protein